MFYFAYGSNTNQQQMAERCPEALCLGAATGLGHTLKERQFADLEPARGENVPGVLWDLTAADRQALDRYEGLAVGLYYRTRIRVRFADGTVKRVLTYRMTHEAVVRRQYVPFTAHYATVCAAGFAALELPVPYLYRRAMARKLELTRV